ncbi:hypothetical protein BC830DRAFT_817680 [Chytriomyces sp. MP71]|nr:hypothetical protein BC830DRAFT_817680 [Chytriomyces sp. MP71]
MGMTKTRPKAGRLIAKKDNGATGATSDPAVNEHHDAEVTMTGVILMPYSTGNVGSEPQEEQENQDNPKPSIAFQLPGPIEPIPVADETIEARKSREEESTAPIDPPVEIGVVPPLPPVHVPHPRPVSVHPGLSRSQLSSRLHSGCKNLLFLPQFCFILLN